MLLELTILSHMLSLLKYRPFELLASHPAVGPWWRLMRLDKPVGTLLVMWPALWGLILAARGAPSPGLLAIFIVGAILMRAAGCAINDFADRKIDGHVERTAGRPLATGELQSRDALLCFGLLCLAAFGLVLLTNTLTIMLAFVGAFLASLYPFLKRWTHLPQIWLGLAMNWGVVMAYTAQANSLHPGVFVLYSAAILWTVVYDTFYAMVDREDDLKIGVKSIAILFGEQDLLMIGILQGLCLISLLMLGPRFELNSLYYWSLAPLLALFVWQQWLARKRDRAGCFAAFMHNRWVGPLVLVALWLGNS